MGVVPRVQSILSRALHAHRGKTFLQSLLNVVSTTIKRAMVKFRGAREKGAIGVLECLGVSQQDTMEGYLWRMRLGRSLGSHDAARHVGGIWLPGRNQPSLRDILPKDGMKLFHPQLRAPPGTGSIPSREQNPVCCSRHMTFPSEG